MFTKLNLQEILNNIHVINTFEFCLESKKDRKKVQGKIKSVVKKYHLKHVRKEYVRAIGNAVRHGRCPVKCLVYIGQKMHAVITIQDSGQGFDYQDVVNKFKKGKKYYQRHGCGIRSLAHSDHSLVDWEQHGRKIILYYR